MKTEQQRHEHFKRAFGDAGVRSVSAPTTASPTPDGSTGGLVRSGGAMAIGTIVSRATGFLRTVVLLAALGSVGAGDAYNVANASPNNVYDLLLGGVLTSVLVPLLVRARRDDPDGGDRFVSVLFTITTLVLGAASIVGVVAAPLIIRTYLGTGQPDERSLAITFARLFLPQLVFYAITALAGAVLNTHGRFGAVGIAPVVNNIIVIVTGLIFIASAARSQLAESVLSRGDTYLVGIGTTAGVVGMTFALLPALRSAGIRLRFIPDFREPRLRLVARLGGWVIGYAAVNQLGLLVITRLASTHSGDFTVYSAAYQIFQLPHAIIAVSVISALMPALSAAAADRDSAAVRHQLSRGLRLTFVFLLPAALGLAALSHPIATGALHYGSNSTPSVRLIGDALSVFAIGLPAFSAYQLLLRAFYARQDSRTPTLINVVVNVVNIAADLILITMLPAHLRVPALAAGLTLSYVAGTAIAFALLRTDLRGIDGARILRLAVRASLAGLLGSAVARIVADLVRHAFGANNAAAILASTLGAGVGIVLYVWAARRMRVRELTDLLRMLRPARG